MANSERPAVTIKARVLDSMQRYLNENKLFDRTTTTGLNRAEALMDPKRRDDWVDYLVARAADEFDRDPGAIFLQYDHAGCGLALPPGRQFSFKHTGGYIEEIKAILPLEPMSWDEMQVELAKMIAMFDTAGWKRSTGQYTSKAQVKEVITFDDFLDKTGPKWAAVGFWEQCDNPFIKGDIQIKHYNSSASGSFVPPAQLSEPLDPTAEDTFLFVVTFQAEYDKPVERELRQLRDARRLEVNGSADQQIPLSLWIDDPDWRPEGWDGTYIK